jgi:hypothetical protein
MAQNCIDGSRVKGDTYGLRLLAAELNRKGSHKLVQGRLRRSVAIPAPAPVVLDAADARREDSKDAFARFRHKRKHMLAYEGRTNCIYPEASEEMLWIKGAIGLLGLESGIVKQSCRHQDEAQGSAFNKLLGCSGNARLVLNVDLSHLHTSQAPGGSRAGERMNGFEPLGRKKVCDGGSDAAGRADNKCSSWSYETVQEQ